MAVFLNTNPRTVCNWENAKFTLALGPRGCPSLFPTRNPNDQKHPRHSNFLTAQWWI